MEGTWFAIVNAALFVLQAVVNIVYAKRMVATARDYETLITPANYAFVLWILVYALEAVLVAVDVFSPRYSMFADANQPGQLRLCFGATCILNTIWVYLFVTGHVYASTVIIFVLWLALLVLYVYAVNDRNARNTGPFDWVLYLCNEVPISMYFAWVTTVAFTGLAMSMQHSNHEFLRLTTYVSYLCVVILVGLLTSRYAQDLITGLVIIWYLIAVSIKHVQFPHTIQCMDIAIRACAGEGAAIIAAVLAINLCQSFMEESLFLHVVFCRYQPMSEVILQPLRWVQEWVSSRVPPTGPPVHNSAIPAVPRATARTSIAVHSIAGIPVP